MDLWNWYVRTLGWLTHQAWSPPGTEEVPRSVLLTSRTDRPSNIFHMPSVAQEVLRDCFQGPAIRLISRHAESEC